MTLREDVDEQRKEISWTQDDLVEGAGNEVGGSGWARCAW